MELETTIGQIRIQRIGFLDTSAGRDEYLLVRTDSDQARADSLESVLTQHYYRDTNSPGGYFCHSVAVSAHPMQSQLPADQVDLYIAVVFHRYDC